MKRKERLHPVRTVPGAVGFGGMAGDDLVHLSSVGATAFEALCDFCDTGLAWEQLPTGTPISCPICKAIYSACRATRGVVFA